MMLDMMTTETKSRPANEICCAIPDRHFHPEENDGAKEAAAVFRALADETRLRILKGISQMGELCECNIVPVFGLSQPTVNYHLKVLRAAGLVNSERRGQWVYHRVNQKAVLGAVRDLTEVA
jgi:ArsR family transcriptional regulator, arsenate/arsenite/antimonite-responsive transcriptional repressor